MRERTGNRHHSSQIAWLCVFVVFGLCGAVAEASYLIGRGSYPDLSAEPASASTGGGSVRVHRIDGVTGAGSLITNTASVGVDWSADSHGRLYSRMRLRPDDVSPSGSSGASGAPGMLCFDCVEFLTTSDASLQVTDSHTQLVFDSNKYAYRRQAFAFDPNDVLYVVWDLTAQSLARVNPTTGAVTKLFELSPGFGLIDIDFAPDGQLFGLSWNSGLVRIDTTNGAVTQVSDAILDHFVINGQYLGGMAFDDAGTLYVANESLFIVDTTTGNVTDLGVIVDDGYIFTELVYIPEPTSVAMLVVGVCFAMRRRLTPSSPGRGGA